MYPPTLAILLYVAVTMLASACSFRTYEPEVRIQLSAEGRSSISAPAAAGVRPGPPLETMNCFGLVVNGAPGAVTSSQVGGRIPSCLGLNGAFYGPYSYAQMKAGVSITLPPSTYGFSLVGFSGVVGGNCGSSLSALYANDATPQSFAVGSVVNADLREQKTIVIAGTEYNPATAVDRTASCPVPSLNCTGASICDTFNAANGTPNSGRFTEIGGSDWIPVNLDSSALNVQNLRMPVLGAGGDIRGIWATHVGTTDMRVQAILSLGESTPYSQGGVIARFGSVDDYILFGMLRDDNLSLCQLNLIERVASAENLLRSTQMSYPVDCPYDEDQLFSLTTQGTTYTGVYRGVTLEYNLGLMGTYTTGGFYGAQSEGVVSTTSADTVRFDNL